MPITILDQMPFRQTILAALAFAWAMKVPAAAPEPETPAAAKGDAEAVRAVGRLLGAGFDALRQAVDPVAAAAEPQDEAAPVNAQEAAAQQRKQQIAQQAKQMEQFFQPALQAELELIKNTCSGLPADARKQIVAAGWDALRKAAHDFATQQFNGNANKKQVDTRRAIQLAVTAAVKPHASAEEFAAYEAEQQKRLKRRERAARVLIVAKLDRQLELTTAQRQGIETALEEKWDAAWVKELQDNGGMMINNYQPAPDFAAACIEPHLDEKQRAEWKKWSQQAGWGRMGGHFNWNFDGQSLQPDPWWSR